MKLTISIEVDDLSELHRVAAMLANATAALPAGPDVQAQTPPAEKPSNVVPHPAAKKDAAPASDTKAAPKPQSKASKPKSEAKPSVDAKEAPATPATGGEGTPQANGGRYDRQAIVDFLGRTYKEGTDDVKAQILQWRKSQGLNLLREMTDEQLPSATEFAKELGL
jgi:hypothetical protein